MSAELRLSLSDETAAKLDAIRQPASRTAYAAWLLENEIGRRYRAAHEQDDSNGEQDR